MDRLQNRGRNSNPSVSVGGCATQARTRAAPRLQPASISRHTSRRISVKRSSACMATFAFPTDQADGRQRPVEGPRHDSHGTIATQVGRYVFRDNRQQTVVVVHQRGDHVHGIGFDHGRGRARTGTREQFADHAADRRGGPRQDPVHVGQLAPVRFAAHHAPGKARIRDKRRTLRIQQFVMQFLHIDHDGRAADDAVQRMAPQRLEQLVRGGAFQGDGNADAACAAARWWGTSTRAEMNGTAPTFKWAAWPPRCASISSAQLSTSCSM